MDCPGESLHELLFREGRDLETLDDAPVLLRPLHDRITDAGRVDQPSAMVVPAVILVEGVSPWGGAGEYRP
jgi:hypothetical protein